MAGGRTPDRPILPVMAILFATAVDQNRRRLQLVVAATLVGTFGCGSCGNPTGQHTYRRL